MAQRSARELAQPAPTYGSRGGSAVRRAVTIGQFGGQVHLPDDHDARPEILDRIQLMKENASLNRRDGARNVTMDRPQRTRAELEEAIKNARSQTDLDSLVDELSNLPEVALTQTATREEQRKLADQQLEADDEELAKRGFVSRLTEKTTGIPGDRFRFENIRRRE
jgi:hypothetical protein